MPQRGADVDAPSLWRSPAYVWCFLGLLVGNMFSGNWHQIGVPLGLDRILFVAGMVLLLLDPAANIRGRLRWRPVHVLLLVMLLLTAWSALSHGTLTTSYGAYALLDRLAVPFALFAVAPVVFGTTQRRDMLLRCLVLIGFYLGLTAFFEVIGPHFLVFPRYIMDPNVGIQFGRARGPFAESEADGMTLCICGFAAAYAATRLPGRWRWGAGVSAALCALGVFLSLTRSVWVGTGVGLVVVLVFNGQLRKYLAAIALGAAMTVIGLLASVSSLRASASGRVGDQRSVWDRQNVNAAALRIIRDHPLGGVGWMRFLSVGTNYVRQADTYPITTVDIEVHNVYLSRAAELGLPGAALFIACLLAGPGLALLSLVRRPTGGDLDGWRYVLVGAVSVWVVCSLLSPLPYPLPNSLLWLIVGIVLTPYLTRKERVAQTASTPVLVRA